MIVLLQVALLLIWVGPSQPQTSGITTPLPCEAPEGWIVAGAVDSGAGHEPIGGCTKDEDFYGERIAWRCEDRYCCQEPCSCNTTDNMYASPQNPMCAQVISTHNCYVQFKEFIYKKIVCCVDHVEDEHGICVEPFDCDKHSARCEGFCIKDGNVSVCDCKFGFKLVNETKCVDVDECDTNNGGCGQICQNTDGSYKCACKPGWSLFQGSKCFDIDECRVGSAKCSHGCINTEGGYNCTCPSGMDLADDWHNCAVSESTTAATESNNSTFLGAGSVQVAGKKVPLLVLILAPLLAVLFLILLCCFLGFRYCRKEAEEEPYTETVVAFDNMAYDSATGVTVLHTEEDEIKKKEPEPADVIYVEPESDKKKLEMMAEYDEAMGQPPPYTETDPMEGAWALPPAASKLPQYGKEEQDEEGFYEEIPEHKNYATGPGRNEHVLPDQVNHYVNVNRATNPWTGRQVTPASEAEEQNQINDLVQDL